MSAIHEWNDRLQQCHLDAERKIKLERTCKHLETDIADQRSLEEACLRQLRKEESEAERLASSSFSHFWFGLFGSWEERLDKERREAVAAKLRYDAARDQLQRLEAELAETNRQLAEVLGAPAELERFKRLKEAWIRQSDSDASAELEALSDRLASIRAALAEITEAEEAGRLAKDALLRAQDRLESAKNWGTYDMLGGGMIATMVKHGRIDDARDHIHEAQHHLRRFARELKDVHVTAGAAAPEIGGFLSFSDYFFDGFITDWMVQGKINDSLDSVRASLDGVGDALGKLNRNRRQLESEAAGVRSRYERLVEDYGA